MMQIFTVLILSVHHQKNGRLVEDAKQPSCTSTVVYIQKAKKYLICLRVRSGLALFWFVMNTSIIRDGKAKKAVLGASSVCKTAYLIAMWGILQHIAK